MFKPYYEEENITIYNGDCLEVMKEFPDKSIDLIVTSPPYNMRLRIRNGEYTQREMGAHFSKKYKNFKDALPMEEYYKIHSQALREMLRVSPIVFWNIQIVTGSKEAIFKIIGDFSREITDIIVWDKGFGQPSMNKGVLNRGYELIIALEADRKNGRTFNKYYFGRGTLQDIWRLGRGGNGSFNTHTAIFPKSLVNNLLENWTRPGDTILDPFLGSGTTARACKDLGRKCVGIEISKEYCDIAVKRLGQEILNLND